jgi:hypothetical protein
MVADMIPDLESAPCQKLTRNDDENKPAFVLE